MLNALERLIHRHIQSDPITAAIGGGASLLGSIIGAGASSSAASSQAGAAQNATNAQVGMFNTVMGNLKPYQTSGGGALNALDYGLGIGGAGPAGARALSGPTAGMPAGTDASGTPGSYGYLTHAFGPTDLTANLAPNYGFDLSQGLGAVQNENAATGGALSGNALSGITSFTQNYARNAYQQAFENYQANQQAIYGRLGNLAQLGEAASTGSASGAPSFAQGISQSIQGVGAANAAGTVGVANALTGGLNNLSGYYALNNLFGGGGGGGGGIEGTVPFDVGAAVG